MIIDNHVHIGWYSDGYHSPETIWVNIKNAGIEKIVVSSTTTCADLFNTVITEFEVLSCLEDEENIKPVLWISPKMIKEEKSLSMMLNSKIKWKGLKLHYISHPEFCENSRMVDEVLDVSRCLGSAPILLHTGEWESCHAAVFESMIAQNPDLKFVLAHGRPIKETIVLMKKYSNVWTDTAFMPIKDLKKLKKEGLTPKVLFGTDAPINQIYYPDLSTVEYLKLKIEEVRRIEPSILENTVY